jgi:predicted transcriptional regulator
MMLQSEIAFYLLRFYLYTKINKFARGNSSSEIIKVEILRAPFGIFLRFIEEPFLDLKQGSKDNADINEELVNWAKIEKNWDIMKEKIIAPPLSLENPNVQHIIAIAEDMMNQNKTLTIERLYNVSKKVLKIPRSGLISIIHFLINNHVLLEGSKFSRETVLENYLRKNILEYIQLNGCAHFSILRNEVISERDGNLGSSGQLVWHLEMLMKFNYIKKIKVGNYTVFLPIEMEVELGIINFLLKDEINRKIINLLTKQDSIKSSEIFKLIDENRGKVNYRLNNLNDYELICFKEDSSKEVYLNPDKKEDVNRILNIFKISL